MTRSHRFTAEQAVAFLAGRLTQLRVPVKPQPSHDIDALHGGEFTKRAPYELLCEETDRPFGYGFQDEHRHWLSPFGKPGDTLWGKEKFCIGYSMGRGEYSAFDHANGKGRTVFYAATSPDPAGEAKKPWQPSNRMKQADSRIFATVRRVWVERVQEISEADAIACGAQCAGWPASLTDRGAFGRWWMKRYGPDAWNANGFVWACEIERKPEGMR